MKRSLYWRIKNWWYDRVDNSKRAWVELKFNVKNSYRMSKRITDDFFGVEKKDK